MRMHDEQTGERDRIRLMSFAQTRREANVIYEDRATSRVGEVPRLKNLWNDVETSRNGAFSMRSGASKTRIQFPRGNFAVLRPRDFDRSLHGSTEREPSKCGWSKAELAAFKSDKISGSEGSLWRNLYYQTDVSHGWIQLQMPMWRPSCNIYVSRAYRERRKIFYI